ncbi:pimeloyl-ACP methyl ester esterase BioH [Thalassotalea psychrophila]|uniref:Pimeloyl-[acyl-carrier protein] methyl ester esterase n=1 Tax=Thalassotalea psychrophila TaxID=3065647 RepID=A0ABY9TUB5_9GAMM|nr:pimeloyl-ACP methyl ester esterase BioH [Colwelliaceae bacterium SQ149]
MKFNILGSGFPLVFIHGWGLNSAIFSPMVEKLSANYQVTTIDLPGFGQNTEVLVDDYSLENITAMVAACITQPSIIIGWSLGGLIATNIALHHPEKAHALVSVTSSPYFVEQPNWPGIKAELLQAFHQQLSVDAHKTIEGFLKIQAMGSEHVRNDVKQIKALINQYPEPNTPTLDASLSLLETVDLRAKIQALNLPILRMYGRLDSLVPKAMIEQMNKLLPDSDSYTFHRASHAPFISHSDEFYTVLTDWITGNIKPS